MDRLRLLVNRHLPGLEILSLVRLGEGADNVVCQVNNDLIIRVSKEPNLDRRGALIRREADLLAAVAKVASLPVPEVIFADPDAGALAYTKLSGAPLSDHPVPASPRLAGVLGEFASSLHGTPVEKMEPLVPLDMDPMTRWRGDAERDYLAIAEQVPPPGRLLVEDFLGRSPPPEPQAATFCHNDLGAEHILVHAGSNAISGVIDWTDAAIADPAVDVALVFRDLGPRFFELTLPSYARPFDEGSRARAVFYARCALLEDIEYGLRTGARRYLEAGLANLERTFR